MTKKLAISLGVHNARALLARQGSDAPDAGVVTLPWGEIAYQGDRAVALGSGSCLFVGLPINGPDLAMIRSADDAALRFPEFDGAFIAVFWDEAVGKLVLVTDFLGLQPLYLRRCGREIELATETKAFEAEPDLAGWGAFISMGHTIGQKTLLEGVSRLPAAALLIYDGVSGDLRIERYWDWPSGAACTPCEVVHAFQDSVAAYQSYGVPASLMLSGGFDSRLLLYALREMGIRPDALIVSHQDLGGDTDGRLGRSLARREKLDFRFIRPRADFFSSVDLLDYVDACDAAVPTMDLFIAKLFAHIRGGAIWDGLVPGFTLRLVFRPGGGFKGYVSEKCRGWDDPYWRVACIVFGEETARAMHAGFEEALCEEISRFGDDDIGIFRFIAENRIRHRTSSNPLKVLSRRTLPYIPGMTKAFFDLIADLPRYTSGRNDFYLGIFKECFPQALEVPLLRGSEFIRAKGAPWHYWRYWAISLRDRLLGLHPSMDPSRYLGRLRRTGPPRVSSFILADDALFEEDGWLDADAIRAVQPGDPLYGRMRVLLFHWKAWQWVHQRRLHEALMPFASVHATAKGGSDIEQRRG